ncbi:MAG: hypothetical protein QM680_13680 [Luteolibacter sp.]
MTQLVIFLVSSSRYAPPKIGGFIFNPDYGKYLYKGRTLTVEEFNEAAKELLDRPNPNLPYAVSARAAEVSVEPQDSGEKSVKKKTSNT